MRLFTKKADDFKTAQQERRIPVTIDDHDEVTQICETALAERYGHVVSSWMTRGGIVVRGTALLGSSAPPLMRAALESVGYVLGDDFGRDAVVVIGWDPARYHGAQMTVARVDDRIDELLALRGQLLESESDARSRL
ncbi:hypothetical protein ABZ912_20170 [Nonomuraea angiospora]|uniref:hypothetical protein n=1 Tax=Nonomuraea angiospora TaxID=46172 RepID=UPI0033EFEC1C